MINLKGKTIFITGASSGIGRATAVLCDQIGANIILSGRNKKELSETQKLLHNKSQIIIADLTNEEEIIKLTEQMSKIDGFVHCAGIIKPLPIKFIRSKHISEIFDINFSSAVLLSSHFLSTKKINNNASIVFISSISSQHPYPGGALYTASKSSLEAFSRAIALENAVKKIRSNIVSPGLVRTKILDSTVEGYSPEELSSIEKQYPLGFGEPIDVANTIVFLLSDASKWITGSTIQMDGGLLLNNKK